MTKSRLSYDETMDLIQLYRSELNKLVHRVSLTTETINQLERDLKTAPKATVAAAQVTNTSPIKRGRGRPPKAKALADIPKIDGRKFRQVEGGYKLSDWDEALLEVIGRAQKPLINQEILDGLQAHDRGKNETPQEVRAKMTRSINKLANRRDELVKLPYEGRGFCYALREWVSEDGRLKKKYQ